MHVIADLLDKMLKDRRGHRAGRVDGVVIRVRKGQPPRLTHIEVGPETLLARFSSRLARRYAALDRRIAPERGKPFRIPWEKLTLHRRHVEFDGIVEDTPIMALEAWLRRTIVERIPGA